MSTTTNLALPFLTQGQAQKHVTMNETLLRLDALVQLAIVSASVTAQPASPSDGQIYILPSGKTGTDWGPMSANALAYYRDGIWEQITPREGWRAYVKDTDLVVVYNGSAWTAALTLQGVFTSAPAPGNNALTLVNQDAGNNGAAFVTYHDSASPAAADRVARWRAYGRDSAANQQLYGFIDCLIDDATDGSEDSHWQINSVVAGASTQEASIGLGLVLGAATGGAKGVGTLNATAVYDDNVLLTCGPVELMRDGALDLAKWDALAQSGGRDQLRHDAMHHFAGMLAEGFDPRDPSNFCARLAHDGAAPGLMTETEWRDMAARGEKPAVGAMMTRVFLALDNLAVAFAGAMKRIDALEARAP